MDDAINESLNMISKVKDLGGMYDYTIRSDDEK